jgi:hypothetical protein
VLLIALSEMINLLLWELFFLGYSGNKYRDFDTAVGRIKGERTAWIKGHTC